ncbi:uncharacterized protein LOC126899619 isoform X1 [Daktulosphaira vitifoliae]|uniref:uncharacterized protein LOC126899619 isoform X1 n=1 Tax=Daktulosphaira vitifoliae TaxID=58002 RepID=UPI0021AAEB2F|nr:uncharacterized protein LOC126899619 isoform X1 [Daktulosphaira vitifoliae]
MNVAKLLLAFATFTLIYVSAHPIDTTHTAKEHVNEFFNHFKKSEEIDNIKLLIDDYAKKIDIVYGNAQETLKAQGKNTNSDALRVEFDKYITSYSTSRDQKSQSKVDAIRSEDSALADLLNIYYSKYSESESAMGSILEYILKHNH